MVKKNKTVLVSYSHVPYSDSDNDDNDDSPTEEDDDEQEEQNVEKDEEKSPHKMEQTTDNDNSVVNNEQSEENAQNIEPKPFFEDVYGDKDLDIEEFHRSLYGLVATDITLPYATKRNVPQQLQQKVEQWYEKVKNGTDLNKIIQQKKSVRNPSIYEKMITFCQINEMATNYPKELYDPEPFLGPLSYYDELSRLQKEEMDKQERERKESNHKSGGEPTSKKTKWDSAPAPTASNNAALVAALSKAQQFQVNKPTIITAYGTVSKKK